MLLPANMSWPTWHWWITLNASEQGAWASAIASTAAVFAAVAVVWVQISVSRRGERRRQRLRVRILSQTSMGELVRLRTRLETVKGIARTVKNAGSFPEKDKRAVAAAMTFEIPWKEQDEGRLVELDPLVAIAIAELISTVRGYTFAIQTMANQPPSTYKIHPFDNKKLLAMQIHPIHRAIHDVYIEFAKHDPSWKELEAGFDPPPPSPTLEASTGVKAWLEDIPDA